MIQTLKEQHKISQSWLMFLFEFFLHDKYYNEESIDKLSIFINSDSSIYLSSNFQAINIYKMGNQSESIFDEQASSNIYQQSPYMEIQQYSNLSKQLKRIYKHQLIGIIVAKDKSNMLTVRGVGLLISPNLIITAACNIYERRLMAYYYGIHKNHIASFKEFLFFPKQYGEDFLQKGLKVQSWRYPPQFKNQSFINKQSKDYAIMKLSQKIYKDKDIFHELTASCKFCLVDEAKQDHLKLFTPPNQQKPKSILTQSHMDNQEDFLCFYEIKRVSEAANYHHLYDIIYCKNILKKCFNGSPLFLGNQLIGISIEAIQQQLKNVCVLFTHEKIEQLRKWADEIDAEPFKIKKTNLCSHTQLLKQSSIANSFFFQGKKYQVQRQRKNAIQSFTKAIQLISDYQDAYIERANVYHLQYNYNSALKDFQKASQISPNNQSIYLLLADTHLRLKDYQAVLRTYNKIIEINPKRPNMYLKKAEIYQKLNNYEMVLQCFGKAIEVDPKEGYVYSKRAAYYLKNKDYRRAIQDYSRILDLSPKNQNILFLKGQAYELLGEYDQALENYNKTIEIDGRQSLYLKTRGNCHFILHEYQKSYIDYTKALQFSPKNRQLIFERSKAILHVRRQVLILIELQKGLNLTPNNPFYLIKIAACYYDLNDNGKFVEYWSKCNRVVSQSSQENIMRDFKLTQQNITQILAELSKYGQFIEADERK